MDLILIYLFCFDYFTLARSTLSVEAPLYNDLFMNYSNKHRPVALGQDYNKQIIVSAEFGLVQIESVNEKNQILNSVGYIALLWRDELLQWNKQDYGGAEFIILPACDIWLPEITPFNSVTDAGEIASLCDVSRLRIFFDGTVLWIPAMKWQTTCEIDVTRFPFDEQICTLTFGNWIHSSALLNYTVLPKVRLESFKPSNEWILVNSSAWTSESLDFMPAINLQVHLQRNSKFYVWNMVLPLTLLMALMSAVFILPVESGEKVSLGVTLMLSYAIFLVMLIDIAPRTGSIPILSVLILIGIVTTGVCVFVTVCVVNIHHHDPEKPVPNWTKVLIISLLGRCLCSQTFSSQRIAENVESSSIFLNRKNLPANMGASRNLDPELIEVLEYIQRESFRNEKLERNRKDWCKVGQILDRLFFIIFLLYFALNIVLFLSLKYNLTPVPEF